jgi:hypothetical protein
MDKEPPGVEPYSYVLYGGIRYALSDLPIYRYLLVKKINFNFARRRHDLPLGPSDISLQKQTPLEDSNIQGAGALPHECLAVSGVRTDVRRKAGVGACGG